MMLLAGCSVAESIETSTVGTNSQEISGMIYDEIVRIKESNAEIQARKERQEQLFAGESSRRQELEDEETYVQGVP